MYFYKADFKVKLRSLINVYHLCITIIEGQMRNKENDGPFEFNVREGDQHYNQKHYNALGDVSI